MVQSETMEFQVGVTGRHSEPLLPEDLEILRLARVGALKTSFVEAPPNVLTFLQAPSDDNYAKAVKQAYDLGVRHFLIHYEPNIAEGGWGEYWTCGREFARWWIEVWAEAQSKWPDAQWGFPAMRPGKSVGTFQTDSEEFFEECREALEACDFYEVSAWWKNAEQMKMALWRIDWHQRQYPDKLLIVTFANTNATISKRHKAGEYLEFYQELMRRDNVLAGLAFCVSSTHPAHKFVTWRSEIAQKTQNVIPSVIGGRDF